MARKGRPIDPALRRLVDRDMPQRGELLRYLDGLRQSDEMLQILVDGLERRGSEAVLACYGDHLPSLPHAFAHFGLDELAQRLRDPGRGGRLRRSPRFGGA